MSQSNSSVDYLVNDFSVFKDICAEALMQPVVAIDTEFMRQNTYYADLCLVQIGYEDKAYCIDVLAIDDLSPLKDLLVGDNTLKIFHSCRQDFEVIYQLFGVLPAPLFDTQLAAAFCGYDAQAGYARVVNDELGVELDKSQTRTDWSRRPLSEAQISYAAEDVLHLGAIYEILRDRLESKGRVSWFEEETQNFYRVDDYAMQPTNAFNRLNGSSLPLKSQHYLKSLAEWRESEAQTKNIPRTWVFKDKELYEIASMCTPCPNTFKDSDVAKVKGVKRHSKTIVDLCQQIQSDNFNQSVWNHYAPFEPHEKQLIKNIIQQVADTAQELGVAQSLLATRKDIETLLRSPKSSRVHHGWRETELAPRLKHFVDS